MVVSGYLDLCKKGFKSLLAVPLVAGMVMLPAAVGAQQAESGQPAEAVQAETQAASEPAAVAAPVEAGDANVGRALFTGEIRFENAGPPCISCHSTGVGALNGGALGPNLTKAYVDESKNPLLSTAWVNGGGSPDYGSQFLRQRISLSRKWRI